MKSILLGCVNGILGIPIIGDLVRGLAAVTRGMLPVMTYLYLVRILCLALLFMAALPLLCWMGPLRSLTVGAFDASTGAPNDFAIVVRCFWAALIIVTACRGVETIAETFACGFEERYPDAATIASNAVIPWRLLSLLTALITTAWMVLITGTGKDGDLNSSTLKAALLGAAPSIAYYLFAVIAETYHDLKTAQEAKAGGNSAPGLVRRMANHGIISKDFDRFGIAAFLNVLRNLGLPLVGILQPGSTPKLVNGVGRAFVYAGFLAALYLLILMFGLSLETWMLPVAAVYFLVVVWLYILCALSFVFDRYRVPVLILVGGFFFLMSQWRESDHYYAVQKQKPVPVAPASATSSRPLLGMPARVLGRPRGNDNPLVVITLAGGGIQAAAWPLAALKKIEDEIPGFHKNVVLLSGVSGGSVGAMYYAAAFKEGGIHASEAATRAAMSSSLSQITVASITDDFVKIVAPGFAAQALPIHRNVLRDRGLALEQSFRLTAKKQNLEALNEATLTSWGKDAMDGKRPAVIMNSTNVETGKRMAFSTVPRSQPMEGAFEFEQLYDAEIGIATAARLSATFPAISPAARPIMTNGPLNPDKELPVPSIIPGPANWSAFPSGGSYLHCVDGGYYENSGMVGAIDWLQEACEQLKHAQNYDYDDNGVIKPAAGAFKLPKTLIILQMSAFPVPQPSAVVDKDGSSRGALFDIVSPGLTAFGIRGPLQAAFSSDVGDLFVKRWSSDPEAKMQVVHYNVLPILEPKDKGHSPPTNLGFLPEDPPLSWHLRECEQQGIYDQVNTGLKIPVILGTAPIKRSLAARYLKTILPAAAKESAAQSLRGPVDNIRQLFGKQRVAAPPAPPTPTTSQP